MIIAHVFSRCAKNTTQGMIMPFDVVMDEKKPRKCVIMMPKNVCVALNREILHYHDTGRLFVLS